MYKNKEMTKAMARAYIGGNPNDYDEETWNMMRDAYWSLMLTEKIQLEEECNKEI